MVPNARTAAFLLEKSLFVTAIVLLIAIHGSGSAYVPPSVKVEPLFPVGLRMSIPHEPGISLVAYHVNFNEDFYSLEAGTIARDIIKQRNGRWVYEDRSTRLKRGDIIYYWTHVVYDGLGYNLLDQNHTVTDFFNYDGTAVDKATTVPGTQSCSVPSRSKLLGKDGQRFNTCPGQLIFEDQFNTLNLTQWTPIEQFSDAPDYEFVVYMNDEKNINVKDGVLSLKPTLLDSAYGEGYPRQGQLVLQKCTGAVNTPACRREAIGSYILPPIISARLHTKAFFTFLYGRVEIRAKLPRGDWIYPLLTLECEDDIAGATSMYYEMRIASATGNAELRSAEGVDLSGHVLTAGALEITVHHGRHQQTNRHNLPMKSHSNLWADDYHVYELLWNSDRIITKVDGVQYGDQAISTSFDRPLHLNVGVTAGGLGEFPDLSVSGRYGKPWRNIGSKAIYNFYLAQDKWKPSWDSSDTSLHVDYIKVWAL